MPEATIASRSSMDWKVETIRSNVTPSRSRRVGRVELNATRPALVLEGCTIPATNGPRGTPPEGILLAGWCSMDVAPGAAAVRLGALDGHSHLARS
jgi:hypothetical protein